MKQLGTALLASMCALGAVMATETMEVRPDCQAIRYVGRFTDDFRFGWSGSMVETDFTGTDVSAILELEDGREAGMTVVVDGQETFVLLAPDQRVYPITTGLVPGNKHRLVLFKRSEGFTGTVRFGGFTTSADGIFSRPPARAHKILAVGDSITCGYGNEASREEEGNTVRNQNGYMSFAAIAARALDADLMMVCWSGKGMCRNLDETNDRVNTIPVLFEQTLPSGGGKWDQGRFVPDVIAINLGTNDMGQRGGKAPLSKDDYVDAYVKFIARLRAVAPDSEIILSIGPMLYDPVREWLPEIAARFEKVSVLIYTPYSSPDDYAGHRHPSVGKDGEMAVALEAKIRKITGWR